MPDVLEHECEWSETLTKSLPSDFNLVFKYGYGTIDNRNLRDTFNATYTQDMGKNPPVTIDFNLSDERMDKIYQKILEIDFSSYPDEFVIPVPDGVIISAFTPYQGYWNAPII